MIELLQNADPVQLVIIGIGLLMVAHTFFSFAMGLFGKSKSAATPLSSLIQKWEVLNQACAEAELIEAQEKLREVFFLLVPKPVSPTDTEE